MSYNFSVSTQPLSDEIIKSCQIYTEGSVYTSCNLAALQHNIIPAFKLLTLSVTSEENGSSYYDMKPGFS